MPEPAATPSLDTETIQQLVTRAIRDDPGVLGVYLFGSRTKGDEHPASDVDLAVLFDRPRTLGGLVDLECRIEDALGMEVDLIDLGKANAFLALDAVRGERIYCADSTPCDEFDLYVLRRAGDLAPFEKDRRRMLLDPDRYSMGARG